MPKPTLPLPEVSITEEDEKRFWEKVEKTASCWLWRGMTSKYGQFQINRKRYYTHRVSFLFTHGYLPEDPLMILHNCPGGDNRLCVNPSHLWVGSCLDNHRDREAKGRGRRASGEQHFNRALTEELVRKIRQDPRAARKDFISMAPDYGVTKTTIRRAVVRESWKHVA